MAFDMSKFTSGSWKTTLIGIITAIAAFIDFDPSVVGNRPTLVSLSKFAMIGGFAAFGIVAKDSSVTGGTRANPKNNPTVVATTAEMKPPAA